MWLVMFVAGRFRSSPVLRLSVRLFTCLVVAALFTQVDSGVSIAHSALARTNRLCIVLPATISDNDNITATIKTLVLMVLYSKRK
jgi:hypothetical protein